MSDDLSSFNPPEDAFAQGTTAPPKVAEPERT